MVASSRPGSLAARLGAATRLLVVEDDPDIAGFLRAYFRASGYDVVHVDPASADEGFAAVRREAPACVLLDLWLRGFNGLQIYRRIRAHDDLDTLPVVVLTADLAARSRTDPVAAGIDGFVAKPFAAEALADLVAQRIGAARELARRGLVDPRSGALTAAALDARFAAELEVAGASGEPLSFALIAPGATLGEGGGRGFVRELRAALPDDAVVGHTDGEELAVLVPGSDAAAAAAGLASALAEVRARCGVTAVAGVASWPAHASDGDALFMAADAALAEASDAHTGVVSVAR